MRHLKKGRKFGRERDIRAALMKSLASSFFMLGRIETTEAKAKELRPMVERIITRGKTETLANRRHLLRMFSENVTAKIFIRGRAYADRNGGYTRIIKTGRRRRDDAKKAIIELVKS